MEGKNRNPLEARQKAGSNDRTPLEVEQGASVEERILSTAGLEADDETGVRELVDRGTGAETQSWKVGAW